jgi:hypothetical protein
MENRYYVQIRLFDNLPEMPEHGKYKTIMVESDSEEEINLLIDDRHKITMCQLVD